MTKDLTTGSVLKNIIFFAIPMCIGMVVQQLYSMVDAMIVGKVLGENPLAGVGATGSLNFMVIYFCMGLCNGFAIPIAQKFGAKREKELREFLTNSIWLCVIIGAIVTVMVCLLTGPALRLLRTPEEIFEYSYIYILVIFIGLPCTIFYNMAAATARALGDSRTPLIALIISSVLNIILDLIFLLPLHMGVGGAAGATVLSQLVAAFYCLVHAHKHYAVLKFQPGEWRFDANKAKHLCGNGFPMGLQYAITAIGSLILQAAVNSLGTSAVAGMTVGGKIYMVIACPVESLGQTMAPFVGQNVGAGNLKRVKEGVIKAFLLGTAWTAVAVPIVLLFSRQLSCLFLDNPTPEVIQYSFIHLMFSCSCFALLTIVNVVRFSIQGMGFSAVAMGSGLMELVARGLAGVVLVPMFGYIGVAAASPLAWLFADVFLIITFVKTYGKLVRAQNERLMREANAN